MRIEQNFLRTGYSLWEVILNGDSPIPTRVIKGVVQHVALSTAEQRLAWKNELKGPWFGGNKETKKVQKTLLKQQYENFSGSRTHTLIWRNKTDLEYQSLDDLFNNLKKYEAEVESSSSASTSTQDIAFVSSQNTNSTNEPVSVVASVYAVSVKVPISALPNVDTLSNVVIYSFFASQSNSPQLDNDNLKQIDADDLEKMDLKWQMAMLTGRARRFLQRKRRNLGENGPTPMRFDMSKVECYNCHKKGHFVREYRSPKDTRRNVQVKTQRRSVPVETSTSNALVSQCDGVGSYDWSFQAEEEPTNYASMAFTSSSSSSSNNEVASCSKACTKAYATLQSHYDKQTTDLRKSQFDVTSYKIGLESRILVYQQNKTIFEEDIKFLKLDVQLRDNALVVRYDNQVFTSSMFDCGEMFSSEFDVSMPASPKYNRYQSGKGYHVVPPPYTGTFMPPKPDLVFHDALTINETVHTAFNVELSPTKPDKVFSPTHKPSAPLIKDWVSGLEDEYEAEPTQNAPSFTKAKTVVTKPYFPPRRNINRRPSLKPSNFLPKVTIIQASKVNAVKGVQGNWVWKPKCPILDHVSRHTSASMTLKKFDYTDALGRSKSVMAWMCDKKNIVLFTNTEYIVLSLKFKFPDENQVLLMIPRENNTYNVDLKNIVPSGNLTCLFAKATLYESNLWHRRLGHINFKTMNKLVKGAMDSESMLDYGYNFMRTIIYIDNSSTIYQTVSGKDSSNPLMADNFPKIIWYSTHHVALMKSLLVQKQTALGKDESNLFRVASLLKTVWLIVTAISLKFLLFGKNVIIAEATVREALRLDDAESIDCLPNEEIFTELSRMGYEKPSTKLTFYKAFFSTQWKFLIHTILQCMSAKRTSWNNFSSSMASSIICLSTGRKFNFSKYIFDSLVRNVDSSSKFYMVETPLFKGMIMAQQADDVADEVVAGVDVDDVPADTVMDDLEDASKQGEIIVNIDADEDVPLKYVVAIAKEVDVEENAVVTATATITAASSAARRRKGVVIRDPKEIVTPSIIIHTDSKSKHKGKGIMRVPNDDDDVYTEATPLALKVLVVDYAIYTKNNKPYYKIIRADGSHQLFLSFLSLLRNFDREDLEMLWQLVKERFASLKPKNLSDDFLLTTLTYMFEKPYVEAQIWKNQRSVHGLAKVKS
nr:ribonuclease H-like domain-containing protein [Tanacetum cinerariifolium]